MVLQQSVRRVVTLCQVFGDNMHADAVYYFPPGPPNEVKLTSVTLKLISIDVKEFIDTRKISIVDNATGKELSQVEHVHFKGWADWQVPVKDSMAAY